MILTGYQAKSTPTCITLSPDSSSFVTFSFPDRQIRVFSFLSGKLSRKYDESLEAIQEMQQAGTAVYRVEDMEFGRRLAVERELELPGPDGLVPGRWSNAIWDESGAFVIYPSLLGVKGVYCRLCACILVSSFSSSEVVNIVTNRVVKLLGKDEVVRFLNLTVYQGAPAKKSITTMVMTAFLGEWSKTDCGFYVRQWRLLRIPSSKTKVSATPRLFVPVTKNLDSTCSLAPSLSTHMHLSTVCRI